MIRKEIAARSATTPRNPFHGRSGRPKADHVGFLEKWFELRVLLPDIRLQCLRLSSSVGTENAKIAAAARENGFAKHWSLPMPFSPKARSKRKRQMQCRLPCRRRFGKSGLLGHQDAQKGGRVASGWIVARNCSERTFAGEVGTEGNKSRAKQVQVRRMPVVRNREFKLLGRTSGTVDGAV